MRTIEDKVWDYLVSRKQPVTVKQIARYYIVSTGSVARALAGFVKKQVVDKVQYGNLSLYKIKD